MRFLLVFLAIFLPLAILLKLADTEQPRSAHLPEDTAAVANETLLTSEELADEYGDRDFVGRVVRVRGVEMRLVAEGEIRYYAKLGELVRHEGRARIRDITFALFEKGKLSLTIESAYAEGEPARLFHPGKRGRSATFGGGVVVRDAQGRELARTEQLEFDPDQETLRAESRVRVSDPENGFSLSGKGLFASLKKGHRFLRLEPRVFGRVALEGGSAKLSSANGPVVVTELAKDHYEISAKSGCGLQHPWGAVAGDEMAATVRVVDGKPRLVDARLRSHDESGADIRIDPEVLGGLEVVRAPAIRVEGDNRIILERPFTAVRKGPLAVLGLDERTIDIAAESAEIALEHEKKPAEKNKRKSRLASLVLHGVAAKDRDGAGHFRAKRLELDAKAKLFLASGAIDARTPDGVVRADTLRLEEKGEKAYDLTIEGDRKRLEYVADGKLGPLGEARRGTLVFTSKGALHAAMRKDSALLKAEDSVRVALGKGSSLDCDALKVFAYNRKLRAIEARGGVVAVEEARGARMECEFFTYGEGVATLRGSPATVRSKEHGTLAGETMSYGDDGAFAAKGKVSLDAKLGKGPGEGAWNIRCAEARGTLRDRTPELLEARGEIVAEGPEGQRFQGDWLSYDGKEQTAVLRGEPAVVRRGDEVELVSPRIDLRFREKEILSAETRWPAEIDFRPKKKTSAAGQTVARWRLATEGVARFEGERLRVPRGATFKAYDEKGALRVDGGVAEAEVVLKGREPVRLVGRKGVEVHVRGDKPATVTADELHFTVATREVDVRGHARVKAEGWAPDVRFERLVFVLTKDGVDLRSASRVKVKDIDKDRQ